MQNAECRLQASDSTFWVSPDTTSLHMTYLGTEIEPTAQAQLQDRITALQHYSISITATI